MIAFKLQNRAENEDKHETSIFNESADIPSFKEQLCFINSLPNYHRWLWDISDPVKQQVKFEQKFPLSTRYPPGSPRNRIINAYMKEQGEQIVVHTLRVLLGIYDCNTNRVPARKKRKIAKKNSRPKIDINQVCENLGVDQDEAFALSQNVSTVHEDRTLYQHYVERLFSGGTLAWRVKKPAIQVVIMNDYDSETGEFKVSYMNFRGRFGQKIKHVAPA